MDCVSEAEIIATGAHPSTLHTDLLPALNAFADSPLIAPRKIYLLQNGLTTGNHKSKEHNEGKAVDFTFGSNHTPPLKSVVFAAIRAGFNGIGAYCNKAGIYSFHLDIRTDQATWFGVPEVGGGWLYLPLITDHGLTYTT
jgi:hypothetical protein